MNGSGGLKQPTVPELRFRSIAIAALVTFGMFLSLAWGNPVYVDTRGHFPDLHLDESASVRSHNLVTLEWLVSSLDRISSDLSELNPHGLDFTSLQQKLASRLVADGQQLSVRSASALALTKIESLAIVQLDRLQNEGNNVALSELRTAEVELELATVNKADIKQYKTQIENLRSATYDWERKLRSLTNDTTRASGIESVRTGIRKEAERWKSFAQWELARAHYKRDRVVPNDASPTLRKWLTVTGAQMPLLSAPPAMLTPSIKPLLDAPRTSIVIRFTTSAPSYIRIRVSEGGTSKRGLLFTSPARSATHDVVWSPHVLQSGKRKIKGPVASNAKWQLSWEVTTDIICSERPLMTQSGSADVVCNVTAPYGTSTTSVRSKPRILTTYATESDIPIQKQHHVFSMLCYPLLGLPRDLVDCVFGVADKIPIVSIPTSFVYAGPGQLLCKPWWDQDYTPFSKQSAGFLSTEEWNTGGQWRYFENYNTWYWPRDCYSSGFSLLTYMALGLPRDLVDLPFGWIDQIPYVSIPISYAYEPVTILTKPWYAQQYTLAPYSGTPRVPYAKQSKSVIALSEWDDASQWVFFENYKTTEFKSPNTEKRDALLAKYRRARTEHAQRVTAIEAHNKQVADTFVITFVVNSTESR